MHNAGAFAHLISRSTGTNRSRLIANFFPTSQRSRALGSSFSANTVNQSTRWGLVNAITNANATVLDFGTQYVVTDPTAVAFKTYEGIGTKDGVLTVDTSKAGPFKVTNVYTTTGELDDKGNNIVKDTAVKVTGNRLKVPIFEGQSYFVDITMPIGTSGTQAGSLTIEDGPTSTLNLHGKVNAPKGEIYGAFGSTEVSMTATQVASVPAYVCTNGQVDPNVIWNVVENPGDLNVFFDQPKFGKVDTKTMTIKFAAKPGTHAGTYPVTLQGTAFNGAAKFTMTTKVDLATTWVQSAGGYPNCRATFLGNSEGDWCITATPGKNFSLKDGEVVNVVINYEYKEKSKNKQSTSVFGTYFNLSEPKFMIASGNDPYVAGAYIFPLIDDKGYSIVRCIQDKAPISTILLPGGGIKITANFIHQLSKF